MPDIPQEVREAAANLYLDLEGEPYSPRDLKVADDHRSGLLDEHPSIIAFHAFQKATIAKLTQSLGQIITRADLDKAVLAERERCAQIAYRTCAETRHVSLGDKCQKAICGES